MTDPTHTGEHTDRRIAERRGIDYVSMDVPPPAYRHITERRGVVDRRGAPQLDEKHWFVSISKAMQFIDEDMRRASVLVVLKAFANRYAAAASVPVQPERERCRMIAGRLADSLAGKHWPKWTTSQVCRLVIAIAYDIEGVGRPEVNDVLTKIHAELWEAERGRTAPAREGK